MATHHIPNVTLKRARLHERGPQRSITALVRSQRTGISAGAGMDVEPNNTAATEVAPAGEIEATSVAALPAAAKRGRPRTKRRRSDGNHAPQSNVEDEEHTEHDAAPGGTGRRRTAHGRGNARTRASTADISLSSPGLSPALVDAATRVHDAAAIALRAVVEADGVANTEHTESSSYYGICRVSSRGNKWQSTLYAGGRSHHLGWFSAARTAAQVYDLWCLRFKGQDGMSRLNFTRASCASLGWNDGIIPDEFSKGVPGTYDLWSAQHPAAAAGRKGGQRRPRRIKRIIISGEGRVPDRSKYEEEDASPSEVDELDVVLMGGRLPAPTTAPPSRKRRRNAGKEGRDGMMDDSDAAAHDASSEALMAHLVGDLQPASAAAEGASGPARRSARSSRMSHRMLASLETEQALNALKADLVSSSSSNGPHRAGGSVNDAQRDAVAAAAAATLGAMASAPAATRPSAAQRGSDAALAADGLPVPSSTAAAATHATLVHEMVTAASRSGVSQPVASLSRALAAYAPAVSTVLTHAPAGVDPFNTSGEAGTAAWNAGTAAVYHHALQQASLANMSMNPAGTLAYMNAINIANSMPPVPHAAFMFPYVGYGWADAGAAAGVYAPQGPHAYHMHVAAAQQQMQIVLAAQAAVVTATQVHK